MKTILFLLLMATTGACAQNGRIIHVSPDGKLKAIVTPTSNQPGFAEHRVEICTETNKRLALNVHSSSDQDHGHGVVSAAWSPDSRFFVYSVTSSGGHSSWHFYTYVYIRERSRFFCLDDFSGPFVTSAFRLLSPNRFLSEARNPAGLDQPSVPIDIQLQRLKWPKGN